MLEMFLLEIAGDNNVVSEVAVVNGKSVVTAAAVVSDFSSCIHGKWSYSDCR